MNLDELQIKISIELDDLNKQLKTVTKGIDKALGPKATKKLMADNNKIIKSGLTSINKTTLNLVKKSRKDTTKEIEAMSKDITKTLNKAFDVSFTKLNSNITSAMNQAKMTVRSACNDIRRELNAALNINGNIRVTSKTSITGSVTGSSGSNAASSISSGQYIGAMIIKATNAVIANNNANTTRLEQAIDNLGNKLTSAIKGMNINTNNDDVVKAINNLGKALGKKGGYKVKRHQKNDVVEQEENLPAVIPQETKTKAKPKKKIQMGTKSNGRPTNYTRVDSGIFFTLEQLNHKVNFILGEVTDTGVFLKALQEALKASVKATNRYNRFMDDISKSINIKRLGTGSYGKNPLVGGTVNWTGGEDTREYHTGRVVDDREQKQQGLGYKEIYVPYEYKVIDDELKEIVDKTVEKINNSVPRIEITPEILEGNKAVSDNLARIRQELESLETVKPTIFNDIARTNSLEDVRNTLGDIRRELGILDNIDGDLDFFDFGDDLTFVDALESLKVRAKEVRAELEWLVDLFQHLNKVARPAIPESARSLIMGTYDANTGRPQAPASVEAIEVEWREVNPEEKPQIPESAIIDVEWKDVDNVEEDVTKVNKTLTETKKLISDLSKITPDLNAENGMDDYHRKQMSTILDANAKEVGAFTSKTDLSKLKDMMAQLQKMSEELESDLTELFHNVDAQYLEESLLSVRDVIKSFMPRLKEVVETLNGLDAERIKLNIDTADAQRQIEALKASYEMLIEQCKAAYKANNANILRDIIPQIGGPVDSGNKRQYPAKPNLKRGDSDRPSKPGKPPKPTIMGFGFGAYKNEIDTLIEYAKKAGIRIKEALFNSNSQNLGFAPYQNELHELGELAKRIGSVIKEKLSNAFSSIKGFNLGNFNFNQAFDSHVAVHQAGEIKAKLGEIKAKYKETVSEINSIASKLTAPFKKLGSIAYKGISSGLNKAKTALDKFANGCKSSWAKITGIFRKGSNDCGKAMSPLRSSLSSLASMFGLYQLGSIFIDGTKQAIKYEASLMTIQRTLGGASKALIDFANNNAQAFGISKSQVMEFGNIFSVIVSNFEKDGTKVAGTTQKLLESAGIIAGATGYDVNQVLENLRSGILGSSEAVDQLGLNLKVASLEASESFKQIANGAKSWNDLTEAQKQAIIAQEIINQTTAKYGGIVKNTSSMHNAFMAQLSNTKLALGQLGKALYTAILPALTTIMAVLEKVFTYAAKAVTSILAAFGITVDFAANVQPPDDSLGDSVGDSFDDAKDSVEDAEEAVEKFKGSLAGFDEINILSDNTPKAEDPEVPDDGGIGTPEFSEGEGMFDKLGEKFKAFIDEVLEPFKKAWELLGDDLIAEWQDLKESFKHFCDSLGKFLVSVWEHGGKEFVQHMAEIGLACAIAAMEIGGEILDSLARLWDHLDPAKNMNTQGFLNALNEVSVKLRDFILGLGDHFESLMANGGQDVLNALGDCFMNLGEAATRGLGVAIDALDGFIDHLDPAVNENTKNMLQSLADMFHAVGQTALDFVSLLESCLVNGGQDMINAFGDMMMNMGQATSEVITTIMTSFSELFKYLDPTTNEITKNMMKAWEDAFLAIGESALAFSDLFESTMLNGGQEVLNKLGDAFNSLVGLVGTIVEEIADALTGLYEHLDPKTNTFTQNMLKAWQTAFENISSLCDTLGETLSSIMDNGGQDLLNALGDLAMQISEFFATIVGEAAECMGEFAEHIDPSKNKVTAGALDAFKYFIDSIRNFVEMLGDALGTFMDNGGQEFVNNLGDIIALVGDLAFTIGGDIINAITTFMDSWAGQMLIEGCARALEVISEVLEGLLRILEPLSPIISGVVTAIGGFMIASKVVGFIQGIATVFQTIAGSGGVLALAKTGFTLLWGVIAANPIAATVAAIVGIGTVLVALYNKCEWFRDAVNKVFARIKEPVEKLMETFSDLLENVTDIFGNIIDIIVGIFEGDGYKVGEAVRNMVLNVIEIFKGLFEFKQNLAEIGWNLILGLIEGIWECIKNIPQLLAGLGEFVVDFFKGLFGIHSPSTVFKELGINLIEGLIEGIKNMITSVVDALGAIKDAIFGWFEGILSSASENWNTLCEVTSGKWGEIKESITNFCQGTFDNVSEKWKEIKENVSEKCKEIFDDTKEKWTNIKDNVSETISNLKDDASDKYNELKDKLTDTMDKWRQNSEEKWNKIKDKTSDLVSKLKSDTEDKYNKFKEALTDTMDKWRQNSEEKWNKIKDKADDLVSNLKSNIEDKYSKFKDKLTDTMDSWRQNSEEKWTKIKDKTTELATNLKDTVEDKYTKFKDNLTDTMDKWRSNSEDKWNNIKSKTSELVSNLKSDTETKYNNMKEALNSKIESVRSTSEAAWKNIKDKASEHISNLKSDVESKYETLKTNLTNKLESWRSTSEDKWNNIKEKGVNAIEDIRKNGEEKFESLKTAVTTKMETIKTDLVSKWETVKNKAVEYVNSMKSDVENKYNDLKTKIGAKLEEVKSETISKWENIKSTASTKIKEVVDTATSKFGEMKSSFTSKMDEVKNALTPKWTELKNSVKTNASGLGDKVTEGLSGLKNKFTKPFEDAKTSISDAISSIGRTLSNASWSLPKIKLPHLSISGSFSINPPSVPKFSVEWYKRGGIIDGITPLGFTGGTMHMGGEAGKEMVVPLENTSFTSKIAQAMGQAVDNAMARNMNSMYGSSANNSNDSKDIVLKVNERELARASINSINKLQRESGRTLLDI